MKLNVVTLGLFAKHVVIPICDGYKPEKDFSSLLDGLHEEFQPVGLYEEWLVVKIAEYMWRLRRVTRCESGSVRESAIWARREESMMVWAGGRDDNQRTLALAMELGVLDEAQKQLKDAGALSRRIYEKVATIVENEKQKAIRAENDEKSVETEFDRELFLTCIAGRKELVESHYKSLCHIEDSDPTRALISTPFCQKKIWTESSGTKTGCIDRLTGLCRDSWSPSRPVMD